MLNSISLKLDVILGFGVFFLFYFFYGMAMQNQNVTSLHTQTLKEDHGLLT